MAKLSKVVANQKRMEMVARYRDRRLALKRASRDPKLSDEERAKARAGLEALPRNANPIRIRNRCAVTGRSRAYLRKFHLSRIAFRERALRGEIPGVTKASW